MHIVLHFANTYALEEFVYSADSEKDQERDIRLPSERFHLISDPVISLSISSQGITFNENSSNVYFQIINKSTIHKGTLSKDAVLTIITADGENLKLFVYIGKEAGMCFYQTERSRVISLGRGLDQIISCIDNSCLSDTHLLIRRSADGGRINVKGKEGIYLNERYVDHMESASLRCGDVIIAGGIRILWLEECIGVERLYSDKPCIVRLTRMGESCFPASFDDPSTLKEFTPSPRNIVIPDDSQIELDAPPPKQVIRRRPLYITVGPALTMALPMSLGCGLYIYSAYGSGSAHSSMYMYTGLVTALASALLGALWAILNVRNEKKQAALEEAVRVKRYKDYIEESENRIRDKYRYNKNALLRNAPSVREIFSNMGMLQLWNRSKNEKSLFSYRLGVGSLPFNAELKIPREKFELTEDELTELPGKLKKKYSELNDVPICTDIENEPLQGFIGKGAELEQLFLNIALQIASTTGPDLIRMLFIFPKGLINKNTVALMRWLPQTQGDDEHYVCADRERADEILCGLEALLRQPGMRRYRWIIFTDDIRAIPSTVFEEAGVSVLVFATEYAHLSGNCRRIIQNDRSYRGILDTGGSELRKEICFDRVTGAEAEAYIRCLASLKLSEDTMHDPIPSKVTLPGLFDTEFFTAKFINENWKKNNTINSLRAPLGMGGDKRTVFLDIHEKGHGPHGLVAGMTGSGKSEMLQTLILSLAIRYSPGELGFFLIDYKGGGMAALFEGLPHLLGSISNLSGNTIHRAMVSIRSENERRQRLFLKAGVNCIKNYERQYISGNIKEPLPHILIIIDEFAELKREEPDFMKELISVAQVGRSLGVHLILATQKPAGTVDDNIFSNSRFRICLRVQDKQDSNDMLHKPDAAYISNPGRAFLQVGSDELYEEFQAGYTMEPYKEGKKEKPVYLLDEYGRGTVVSKAADVKTADTDAETHFFRIMKLLKESAKIQKLPMIPKLWLPPLKERIILDKDWDTDEKYTVILGRYDEPSGQRQGDFCHNLIASGHTAVCGSNLSGKSTFLQTFIFSHIVNGSPDIINIYIIDYGNGMLSCFRDSKATGAYITEEDEKKLGNLFCMLGEIMKKRRTDWEGISFSQRMEEEGFDEPAILLVIDNYGGFREKTAFAYDREMLEIVKFGEAYGLFAVMTGGTIGSNDIPARLFENCRTGICLRMNDKYQYSECLREIRLPILPDAVRGRGLAHVNGSILEFQTALCHDGSDNERNRYIKEKICELNRKYTGSLARKVPYIPDEPVIADLDEALSGYRDIGKSIPVGYEAVSGKPYILEKSGRSCIVIAGKEGSGKSNACSVIGHYVSMAGGNVRYYSRIRDICTYASENTEDLIICDGMIQAIDEFYREYDKQTEESFLKLLRKKEGIRMVFTVDSGEHSKAAGRRIYEEMLDKCLGIYLGGGLDRQYVFDYSYLPYSEQCSIKPPGTGTVLKRRQQAFDGDIVIPYAEAVA